MDIQSDFIHLENRPVRKFLFKVEEKETIFTDSEAFGICSGLKDWKARQLWIKHYRGKETKEEIASAHVYAMETKEKYGLKTISFLIAIPPLPVGGIFTGKAFAMMDKIQITKKYPILRLVDRHEVEYSISFYYSISEEIKTIIREGSNTNYSYRYPEKFKINNRVYDYNVLVMERDGITLAKIYRDDKISSMKNIPIYEPVIELLINFCDDPKKQILHYGAVTSHCSNCGIPISNPSSIMATVGKICANNLGIEWY